MAVKKISWKLIGVPISLWKVCDCAQMSRKSSLNEFRSRSAPDYQVRTDIIKRTRPILRVSNPARYFSLEQLHLRPLSV